MKLRLFLFRCGVLAIVLALLSRDGNAQLALPGLSPFLQPVSSLFCWPGRLATSPKLDAAARAWVSASDGDTLRVVVSSKPNLLVGTLKPLVSTLGGTVLDELPEINAIVAQVDHGVLVSLVCDASVQSISVDAAVAVAPYSPRRATWYDGTADLAVPGHRLVSSAARESATPPNDSFLGN